MSLQIFRFTLAEGQTIFKSEFPALRLDVDGQGAVGQYYGYSVPVTTAGVPKKRHEITWAIEWPRGAALQDYPSLVERFQELSSDVTSLSLNIDDSQRDRFIAALQSPVCELVPMRLLPDALTHNSLFYASLHKTYTDCYKWPGFVEGDWAYANDANNVLGEPLQTKRAPELLEAERRLPFYILGWESTEIHEDYSKSDLFFEEILKLAPWVDKSSGAWYVRFIKH